MKFKFSGTLSYIDGEEVFMYKGVNLMKYQYQWVSITNKFHELKFTIDDEGTIFRPAVYKLEFEDNPLIFASGEISNSVWGFALPEESSCTSLRTLSSFSLNHQLAEKNL